MEKGKKTTTIDQYGKDLAQQQERFLSLLDEKGLPAENIFVPAKERAVVFSNSNSLLDKMDTAQKAQAIYVSKFFAAVGAGLFDAALNYIWDETILHLRKRIEVYDLEYFYEIASSPEKRKDLKTIDDISKLTDDELLRGALKIELITEAGYRNIDLVRYVRNNASAAHPNQLGISGIKLTAMAEDCFREVISTPIPPAAITVQKLLENVKGGPMDAEDAKHVSVHFPDMGPDRAQRLAEGLFGIFYKRETTEGVRQNIRLLAPLLWPYVDETTRKGFGLKHAYFSANNNISEKKSAREFLSVVNGLQYINDQHREVEILSALDELASVHSSFNNFSNETLPAKRLLSIVGNPPRIPQGIEPKYTLNLVNVFLTNGYGESWSANEIYVELIKNFTPRQSVYAVALAFDENVSSKLQIKLCAKKYLEMVTIIESKISTPAAKLLIEEIKKRADSVSDLRSDEKLKQLAKAAIQEIK